MRRPYSIAFSVGLGFSIPDGHLLANGGLHYDVDPQFWDLFGDTSLLPPEIIIADSEKIACELGLATVERHFPQAHGWRNHEVTATDARDMIDDFVQRRRRRNRGLRFFGVSGVTAICLPGGLQRFTFSGSCIGVTEGAAFQTYKESLDRQYPDAIRVGYVAKVRMFPTERIFQVHQFSASEIRLAA